MKNFLNNKINKNKIMLVETKFNPKNEVFFLKNSKVQSEQVHSTQINIEQNGDIKVSYYVKIYKTGNDYTFEALKEENCFASRNELIAQL